MSSVGMVPPFVRVDDGKEIVESELPSLCREGLTYPETVTKEHIKLSIPGKEIDTLVIRVGGREECPLNWCAGGWV